MSKSTTPNGYSASCLIQLVLNWTTHFRFPRKSESMETFLLRTNRAVSRRGNRLVHRIAGILQRRRFPVSMAQEPSSILVFGSTAFRPPSTSPTFHPALSRRGTPCLPLGHRDQSRRRHDARNAQVLRVLEVQTRFLRPHRPLPAQAISVARPLSLPARSSVLVLSVQATRCKCRKPRPPCRDFQEIKIQEGVRQLSVGSIPRSLPAVMLHELADACKPGDEVLVTGVLRRRWNKPLVSGTRCDVEFMLEAVHLAFSDARRESIAVTEEDERFFHSFWETHAERPLEGRDLILSPFAPTCLASPS